MIKPEKTSTRYFFGDYLTSSKSQANSRASSASRRKIRPSTNRNHNLYQTFHEYFPETSSNPNQSRAHSNANSSPKTYSIKSPGSDRGTVLSNQRSTR